MAKTKQIRITKKELKDMIKKVIDESNFFHNDDGEFSSEKDAESLSRHDIGQYEYPSKKDAFPCGRLSPQRDWCKKGEKKKSVIESALLSNYLIPSDQDNDDFIDELRSIVAYEIERALQDWLTDDLDPTTSPLPRGSDQNPENMSHGKTNAPYETQYAGVLSKKNGKKMEPEKNTRVVKK